VDGHGEGVTPTGGSAVGAQPELDLLALGADLLLFAPLGFALKARTLLPELVQSGRDEWKKRSTVARFVGKLVVDGGKRSLDQRRTGATRAAAPAPDAAPTPTPPVVRSRAVASPPAAAPGSTGSGPESLPIEGYDTLAAPSIIELLEGLDAEGVAAVQQYESSHRGRRTVLARIAQLQSGGR